MNSVDRSYFQDPKAHPDNHRGNPDAHGRAEIGGSCSSKLVICGWSQVKKLRYISGDDLHRGGADAHFSLLAVSLVSLAEAETPAIFLEVHLSRLNQIKSD